MWVVDQIDEGVVCLESVYNKELTYVKISDMPKEVREGDCCEVVSGKWVANANKTEARSVRIEKLFAKVKGRKG